MGFQARVHEWILACMGETIAADKRERNFRFGEEALELLQAAGCSKEDVLDLVEYVYSRKVGELPQEVGGTMVCLAALCTAHGIHLGEAANAEVVRIWGKIDQIRQKHDAKMLRTPHSALPGETP